MKTILFLLTGLILLFASCKCEKCAECSNAKLNTKEKFCSKEPQSVQDWQYEKRKASPYVECKNVDN
jgi:hypothetical protein